MSEPRSPIAVGYVLKRYPRFSETFVVNEILALEKAGVQVDIFALGPVSETHFQEAISRVRAPVHRIRHQFHDTELYWQLLVQARKTLPEFRRLAHLADEHDWVTVGQAVLLAMQAQSKGIRHLHAHFGTQAATVARLAAAFAGIHYSFTAHAKDIYHQYEEPVQLDLKIRDAAFTVTVSDYNVDYLRTHFGAPTDRTHRIYNGLDLSAFPYHPPINRPSHVVAVGRLVEKKGFPFLIEAIGLLRETAPETDERTLRREAHMRKVLRAARRRGHERIAVVCGAWHAPALRGRLPAAKADNALLTGMPRVKTQLTWVPWTHQRLAAATGYGAGVTSPGWYHHLFTAPDEPVVRWLTLVARSLREHDLPASSAHVIEAARLAEALAALRGRPMPGLDEVGEATWSVLCEGSTARAELVTREVVVGQTLGAVPDGVPMVPLDADMRATAKRLRLAFSASARSLVLDLRKPTDLARSHLLRRLAIVGVDWGSPRQVSGTGTFKEGWELVWRPELAVDVVAAASWGTTVASAAGHALMERTDTLPAVTGAVEEALDAGLTDALPGLLRALDERAAALADIHEDLSAALREAED